MKKMGLWKDTVIDEGSCCKTSVRRVPGGWLVLDKMWNEDQGENEDYAITSCFVPDEHHAWDPSLDSTYEG